MFMFCVNIFLDDSSKSSGYKNDVSLCYDYETANSRNLPIALIFQWNVNFLTEMNIWTSKWFKQLNTVAVNLQVLLIQWKIYYHCEISRRLLNPNHLKKTQIEIWIYVTNAWAGFRCQVHFRPGNWNNSFGGDPNHSLGWQRWFRSKLDRSRLRY